MITAYICLVQSKCCVKNYCYKKDIIDQKHLGYVMVQNSRKVFGEYIRYGSFPNARTFMERMTDLEIVSASESHPFIFLPFFPNFEQICFVDDDQDKTKKRTEAAGPSAIEQTSLHGRNHCQYHTKIPRKSRQGSKKEKSCRKFYSKACRS